MCEINASLPIESRVDFAALLEEQCRGFGFQDVLPDGWFFRPYSSSESGFRNDGAPNSETLEGPAIEQAYRRGFDQGFADCRFHLKNETGSKNLDKIEKQIRSWRVRTVQFFGSMPGEAEKPPKKLFGGRNSTSLRMRWVVFERDNFSCVACGRKASNGVTLEVDHIIPHSKGGEDTFENFQTLCRECNVGKSDR